MTARELVLDIEQIMLIQDKAVRLEMLNMLVANTERGVRGLRSRPNTATRWRTRHDQH